MAYYKSKIQGETMIIKVDDNHIICNAEQIENDEEGALLQELIQLKQQLFDTDYIACKIAEGAATREEYAFELEERQEWRKRINEIEALLNS